MGSSLFCKSIKSATISKYLHAAVHPLLLLGHPDPRHTQTGQISPHITAVLHDVKRWESIPGRQEPLTPAMLHYLYHKQLDARDTAITDWLILGLSTGHRRAEWCQTLPTPKRFDKNIDKSYTAFLSTDFLFLTRDKSPVPPTSSPPPHFIQITWRFQKNKANGESKLFSYNHQDPHLCPIQAAKRIFLRHSAIPSAQSLPLALYVSSSGSPRHIIAREVCTLLRKAAKATHAITSTQALSRYSCHSIRVGACVQLHHAGWSDRDIQFTLRWRSTAFVAYLRNLPSLAIHQAKALSFPSTSCRRRPRNPR